MIQIKLIGRPTPRESLRMFKRKGSGKMAKWDPQAKMITKLKAETVMQLPDKWKPWNKDWEVHVTIDAMFSIPKSWKGTKREWAERNEFPHVQVPDCDNLAKLYMDVIKGLIFADDRQVSTLLIRKGYTPEEPHMLITCERGLNIKGIE